MWVTGHLSYTDPPVKNVCTTAWETLKRPCRQIDRVAVDQLKNARLVGRLGSGPRLVADRADVVFTNTLCKGIFHLSLTVSDAIQLPLRKLSCCQSRMKGTNC